MDLFEAIRELLDEKQKLNEVIAYLEALSASSPGEKSTPGPLRRSAGRRGRKSMDQAERLEVSRRMKAYWDSRRKKGPSST